MSADYTRRDKAVEELAETFYKQTVSQVAPPWSEVDPMVALQFRERANDTINSVLRLVTPVVPDVEVYRLRIQMAAQELTNEHPDGIAHIGGIVRFLTELSSYHPAEGEERP